MIRTDADDRDLQLKIETYGDMLFKLCYIRLQNVQDAEDVVQEVFYQYLKHGEIFQSLEHEKAWLLKVAVNACRKVWRSAWRQHRSDRAADWADKDGGSMASTDISGMGMSEDTLARAGMSQDLLTLGPEEAAVKQEERRRLLKEVLSLPVRYREVIHLFYYEDLSVKEIAKVTGRGQSTVTSQLTRGRELLRKALKEEYDFG